MYITEDEHMKVTRRHLRRYILESIELEKEDQFHETFVNELENDIDLSIEAVEGEVPGSIMITMAGPDSISENTITRLEAERLSDMLSRFLVMDAE